MKLIRNLNRFLLAVILLSANRSGLAQSVQSKLAGPVQDTFAEINQRLNEAADVKLASAFLFVPAAEQVEGRMSTQLPAGLLGGPNQSKDAPSRRAAAKPLARLDDLRWIIEPELARVGLPTELAGMVLVESGAQNFALSPKGARGLWQLMPETARRYGLTVNSQSDERLDAYKSTRAAALYLRDLYAQFGNWPLAFAAYNAGGQTVQRAIDRSGTTDFLHLNRLLPAETRNYVPTVLAAAAESGTRGRTFHVLSTRLFYAESAGSSGTGQQLGQ